jgi:hypothetical protein
MRFHTTPGAANGPAIGAGAPKSAQDASVGAPAVPLGPALEVPPAALPPKSIATIIGQPLTEPPAATLELPATLKEPAFAALSIDPTS